MARRQYYDGYSGFPEYVPVAAKKSRNRQAAEKLRGKRNNVQPVHIDGRKIARTWWGESWNANLERYADYSNRIGRGRSYVRHGAVLDLRIGSGTVAALVQGSRGKPYEVRVDIKPLGDAVWNQLRTSALGRLDSLTDLLAGTFPETLRESFFARGQGLFPAPDEIDFDCSCPDWATMCKHVAAVLYGIGNRLDDQPEMLFALRRVSMAELVEKTVDSAAHDLLNKAETQTDSDVLNDADIEGVFGIEFDDADAMAGAAPPAPAVQMPFAKSKSKSKSAMPQKRKTKSTTNKSIKSGRAATRTNGKRKASGSTKDKTTVRPATGRKSTGPPGTMIEQLVAVLPRGRKTFDTFYLCGKLDGWTERQVRNTLNRAISAGKIERVANGSYRRAS